MRNINPTSVNDSPSQPGSSKWVLNPRRVSPPLPEEVHRKFIFSHLLFSLTLNLVDVAMNANKIDLRSLSPPPTFSMQMMQQEIRRLSKESSELQEQMREQKAQVSAVEVFTPTIREYSTYAVQRHHIDSSALLDLQLDDSATLTQRLAALEDISRRLQEEEYGPLSRRVDQLESAYWIQKASTDGAISRMDHLEVYHHELWQGTKDKLEAQRSELSSIRVGQERFEAEVKEKMEELESKSKTTPAALQEHFTKCIGNLTTRVEEAETLVMTMLKSVTKISEEYVKLNSRQSTLENIILQYLGNKKRKNVEVDATKGTVDIGINTALKGTLDIGTNTELTTTSAPSLTPAFKTNQARASKAPGPNLLVPNPVAATRARSPSPYLTGHRKSPRLLEKELVPPSSKSFP